MIYPTAKISTPTKISLGEKAFIGDFVFINLEELFLDDGSQINSHASLTGGGKVLIGKNTVISYGVRIISGSDNPHGEFMNDASPPEKRVITRGTIKIGDNCFIGANAVICVSPTHPNIYLGDGCCIGALSYIDCNVPAWSIVTCQKSFNVHQRIPIR